MDTFFLGITLIILSGCLTGAKAQTAYSYEGEITVEAGIAVNDSIAEMKPFSGSKLLLYKQYLIEPRINLTLTNGGDPKVDTIGYYFIDLKTQTFSEYSKLSTDSKNLRNGDLADKEVGFDFYYRVNDIFKGASDISIRDTIIGTLRCKVASAVKNRPKGKYLVTGFIYPTPELFPVQFSMFLATEAGGGYVKKISLKPIGPGFGHTGELVSEVSFKPRKLPRAIIQIIETWGRAKY